MFNIIHLLTGYEGDSTFIVHKVQRGQLTCYYPNIKSTVSKCFIILNNCAIQNSKLGPFLMHF